MTLLEVVVIGQAEARSHEHLTSVLLGEYEKLYGPSKSRPSPPIMFDDSQEHPREAMIPSLLFRSGLQGKRTRSHPDSGLMETSGKHRSSPPLHQGVKNRSQLEGHELPAITRAIEYVATDTVSEPVTTSSGLALWQLASWSDPAPRNGSLPPVFNYQPEAQREAEFPSAQASSMPSQPRTITRPINIPSKSKEPCNPELLEVSCTTLAYRVVRRRRVFTGFMSSNCGLDGHSKYHPSLYSHRQGSIAFKKHTGMSYLMTACIARSHNGSRAGSIQMPLSEYLNVVPLVLPRCSADGICIGVSCVKA